MIYQEMQIACSRRTINKRLFCGSLAALLGGLLVCIGCNNAFDEKETTVSIIDASLPPTFKLTGSGVAMRFLVYGPYSRSEDIESASAVKPGIWEISPDDYAGKEVSILPAITYGKIPPGFSQIVPKEIVPPQLKDGMIYVIAVPTVNADYKRFCFSVSGGKAIKMNCSEK